MQRFSRSTGGRRVSSARTPKLSDNSSPLPTPPGAVAAVLLLETVFVAHAAYRLWLQSEAESVCL